MMDGHDKKLECKLIRRKIKKHMMNLNQQMRT